LRALLSTIRQILNRKWLPTLIKLQLSQQRYLVIKKGSITIESSEKPKIAFD